MKPCPGCGIRSRELYPCADGSERCAWCAPDPGAPSIDDLDATAMRFQGLADDADDRGRRHLAHHWQDRADDASERAFRSRMIERRVAASLAAREVSR